MDKKLNELCKQITEKQNSVKKVLISFFKNLNENFEPCDAKITIYVPLRAFPDPTSEDDTRYHLVLQDGKFSIMIDDPEYYDNTGEESFEIIEIEDLDFIQIKDILLDLPEAFKFLLLQLENLNKEYDKVLSTPI